MESDHVAGCSPGMNDEAAQDRGDRMQLVLEGGDDPKIPATPAEGPEQVLVGFEARVPKLPVRRDDISGQEVVTRETILTPHPSHAAAECKSSDTGLAHNPTGCCEP